MTAPKTLAAAELRIDLWLWAARFFKTRALAKSAIEHGHVTIDGQPCKPARPLHVGDRLRIERDGDVYEIEVRGLAPRRGPASVAQTLYAESEASREARVAARAARAAERAGFQPPSRRPNKRARRLLRALGDIDAS